MEREIVWGVERHYQCSAALVSVQRLLTGTGNCGCKAFRQIDPDDGVGTGVGYIQDIAIADSPLGVVEEGLLVHAIGKHATAVIFNKRRFAVADNGFNVAFEVGEDESTVI